MATKKVKSSRFSPFSNKMEIIKKQKLGLKQLCLKHFKRLQANYSRNMISINRDVDLSYGKANFRA